MSQINNNKEMLGRFAELANEMQLRANFFKESLLNLENGLTAHYSQLSLIENKLEKGPKNIQLQRLKKEIQTSVEIKKLHNEERVLNLFFYEEIKEIEQFIKQVKASPLFDIFTEEEKKQFELYQSQIQKDLNFFDKNIGKSNYTKFKEINIDIFFKQKAQFLAENEMLIAEKKENLKQNTSNMDSSSQIAPFLAGMIVFSGLVSAVNGQSNYKQLIEQINSKNLDNATSQNLLHEVYVAQGIKRPIISYEENIYPNPEFKNPCFDGYPLKDMFQNIQNNPYQFAVSFEIPEFVKKEAIIKTACSVLFPFEMHSLFAALKEAGLSNITTLEPIVFKVQKKGSAQEQYTIGFPKINLKTQYEIPYSIENLRDAILLEMIGGDMHDGNVLYQDGKIICIDSDAMWGRPRHYPFQRLHFGFFEDVNLDEDFKVVKQNLMNVAEFISKENFFISNNSKEAMKQIILNEFNNLDRYLSELKYNRKIQSENNRQKILSVVLASFILLCGAAVVIAKREGKDNKQKEPYKETELPIEERKKDNQKNL